MDSKPLDPEQAAELRRDAARGTLESLLFSACYSAMKKTAQHMLDQMAKQNVPAELGVEMVHVATVAVGEGFRQMAIEHLHVRPDDVDAGEKRAKALGEKIYRDKWAVLLKTATGGGIVEVDAGGHVKGESGLVGLDGKLL